MTTQIHPATGNRLPYALRLLFARFPVEEQENRLRDALAASEKGTLNLDHLLLAETDGMPVGAALVMLQTDGVALVWPPVVSCGAENESQIEDLLMREICGRIDSGAARLAQCLLTPDDELESELLIRNGFHHATDMFFMARALTPDDMQTPAADFEGTAFIPCPVGNEPFDRGSGISEYLILGREQYDIRVESYREENSDRFIRVIDATYEGSLDCQYLSGIRSGSESIASYKLSGVFDPTRWELYSIDGKDAGVAMWNDHPEQDAVELVYLGVVPEQRGRGLGKRMLRRALSEAAMQKRAAIFLAVDCENSFANSLYTELAFAELARRKVMLRHPLRLARQ